MEPLQLHYNVNTTPLSRSLNFQNWKKLIRVLAYKAHREECLECKAQCRPSSVLQISGYGVWKCPLGTVKLHKHHIALASFQSLRCCADTISDPKPGFSFVKLLFSEQIIWMLRDASTIPKEYVNVGPMEEKHEQKTCFTFYQAQTTLSRLLPAGMLISLMTDEKGGEARK